MKCWGNLVHELAVCQGLIRQVEKVAASRGGDRVSEIILGIGPLSGVEPHLVQQAWPIASAGGIADNAELIVQALPVRVYCGSCDVETDALPNRLVCGQCGDWRTTLAGGDELLLVSLSVEFDSAADAEGSGQPGCENFR